MPDLFIRPIEYILFFCVYPIGGGVVMTPLFKMFLMCSATLLAAINVADAFNVDQTQETIASLELVE